MGHVWYGTGGLTPPKVRESRGRALCGRIFDRSVNLIYSVSGWYLSSATKRGSQPPSNSSLTGEGSARLASPAFPLTLAIYNLSLPGFCFRVHFHKIILAAPRTVTPACLLCAASQSVAGCILGRREKRIDRRKKRRQTKHKEQRRSTG